MEEYEIFEDEDQVVEEEQTDEHPICSNCNGSGEGMHEGSRCYVCKGRGTV
jgi:DnaJ-class molecular chaperone